MAWRNSCGAATAKGWQIALVVVGFQLPLSASQAATAAPQPMLLASASLADMSLEELGNIEITSVSRRAERLSDAAASIFVITEDDIRRSGATSLPEALRLAPNLQVAQVNSSAYAISARGFNNAIGNKLLVLIDGRTVYTPLYSGVNWDAQHVMLEDVERIEVISGPGATLWGANAVNGVINVITRTAQDTQGVLLSAGSGNRGSDAAVRKGGKLDNGGYYRLYGMTFNRENTERSNGSRVSDAWHGTQGGFRVDWDNFTLQGDSYRASEDPLLSIAGGDSISGANLLARWRQELGEGAAFQIQAYYDYTERESRFTFNDATDLFDVEFQHSLTWAKMHKLVWGGGYRQASNRTQANFNPSAVAFGLELIPAQRRLEWSNLFLQDQMALTPQVDLTLGAKVETNVYSNAEFLPSVRLAWKRSPQDLLWGALSRAVRAPSRIDTDFRLHFTAPPGVPFFTLINGGPKFESEIADVLEIGYRAQPSEVFNYSMTAYYSEYDKLRSGQPAPAFIQNMMEGTVSGIEAWGNYQVFPSWRLSGGLSLLHEEFRLKPGSLDPDGSTDAANDPAQTWTLRSTYNLTSRHDFDVMLRRVGSLPNPAVPHYTAVDARLAWRPQPDVELSLTLQNLLAPPHVEFGASVTASEFDRAAYFKLRWSL